MNLVIENLSKRYPNGVQALRPSAPSVLVQAQARVRDAPSATLFLDYDGTLVEFAPTPELAVPDVELL
ncbi:MAG: hypothetical protein ACXWK9_08195, partial [Myxococcaceae bacterium]